MNESCRVIQATGLTLSLLILPCPLCVCISLWTDARFDSCFFQCNDPWRCRGPCSNCVDWPSSHRDWGSQCGCDLDWSEVALCWPRARKVAGKLSSTSSMFRPPVLVFFVFVFDVFHFAFSNNWFFCLLVGNAPINFGRVEATVYPLCSIKG